MSTPSSKRQAVLQAAGQIILAEGAANLTLDAVARQAGVSKGGLLYHFPSKDALIAGLVEYLSIQFAEVLQAELTKLAEPLTAGVWLRAYIRATFGLDEQLSELSAGLIAAVALNPTLLDPLREHFKVWQQQTMQTATDPALATAIRLAVDGLWFAELLSFAPFDLQLRSEVISRLIDLTYQLD